jgi:hypothetical protein
MKRIPAILFIIIFAVSSIAGCSTPNTDSGDYDPVIDPENFSGTVDNPYFTLEQGSEWTYFTDTDNGTEKEVVIVTENIRVVSEIATTEVLDRVWLDDVLAEETLDWYAQDSEGNVWCFGEDSRQYDSGSVISTDGSWMAGTGGAKAGIVMEADPKAGDSYRKEYYPGHAEDMADVVSLAETATVPYGTFVDCLKTRDWSKVGTSMNEYKYYSREVGGCVLEIAADSGERKELVTFVISNDEPTATTTEQTTATTSEQTTATATETTTDAVTSASQTG